MWPHVHPPALPGTFFLHAVLPYKAHSSEMHVTFAQQVARPAALYAYLLGTARQGARQVLLELVLPKRSNGTTMGRHCRGLSCSCLPTCRQQHVSPCHRWY